MLIPIMIVVTGLLVTSCSSQRVALTDELAVHTHTLPFALNGGYELGSIVTLDSEGLPKFLAGKGTLLGKVRTEGDRIPLPSSIFDRTGVLIASASANPTFADSPRLKANLKNLDSFTLEVTQWSKQFIKEGPMAFERWLSDTNPDVRQERQDIIRNLEHLADNEDIYYIYEVIEVQQGSYHAKWKTHVDQQTTGQIFRAVGLTNSITSDNSQQATAIISRPTLVAYRAHRWKIDRLRKAVQGNPR